MMRHFTIAGQTVTGTVQKLSSTFLTVLLVLAGSEAISKGMLSRKRTVC